MRVMLRHKQNATQDPKEGEERIDDWWARGEKKRRWSSNNPQREGWESSKKVRSPLASETFFYPARIQAARDFAIGKREILSEVDHCRPVATPLSLPASLRLPKTAIAWRPQESQRKIFGNALKQPMVSEHPKLRFWTQACDFACCHRRDRHGQHRPSPRLVVCLVSSSSSGCPITPDSLPSDLPRAYSIFVSTTQLQIRPRTCASWPPHIETTNS
jgi:hypothetical protein